jgi:hypothetical protein
MSKRSRCKWQLFTALVLLAASVASYFLLPTFNPFIYISVLCSWLVLSTSMVTLEELPKPKKEGTMDTSTEREVTT